jgi:hypothetical protein
MLREQVVQQDVLLCMSQIAPKLGNPHVLG